MQEHLMPYATVNEHYKIYHNNTSNKFYIRYHNEGDRVTNDKIQEIPSFVVYLLQDVHICSYWIGPFAFFNDFENTTEGKWILTITPWVINRCMTYKTKQKLLTLLQTYKPWVQIDTEYCEMAGIEELV